MLLVLPSELQQTIFSTIDASTKTSLRLVCRQITALLPYAYNDDHRFFMEQCCVDGHYQLFLLATQWKQPFFSHYYTLAVKSNNKEIIEYLLTEKVTVPAEAKVLAAKLERTELYALLPHSAEALAEIATIPDQMYVTDITERRESLQWAIKHNNYSLIQHLLTKGKRPYQVTEGNILFAYHNSVSPEIMHLLLSNAGGVYGNQLLLIKIGAYDFFVSTFRGFWRSVNLLIAQAIAYQRTEFLSFIVKHAHGKVLDFTHLSLLETFRVLDENEIDVTLHNALFKRIVRTGDLQFWLYLRDVKRWKAKRACEISLTLAQKLSREELLVLNHLFPMLLRSVNTVTLLKAKGREFLDFFPCKEENILRSGRTDCLPMLVEKGYIFTEKDLQSAVRSDSIPMIALVHNLMANPTLLETLPKDCSLRTLRYLFSIRLIKEEQLYGYLSTREDVDYQSVLHWLQTT